MDRKSLRQWLSAWAGVLLASTGLSSALAQNRPTPSSPPLPWPIIAHSPASSGLYIGSPSLAVLPGGDYVASHDFFGPASNEHRSARTRVYRSNDRGLTWRNVSEVQGGFWSSLFVHRGTLYLLGLDRHHGNIVIRRSEDGGATWTVPADSSTGLLRDNGEYHCAPVPVIEHDGRLWRGFEWRNPPTAWGVNYRAGMLSAPVDADLLASSSWTASEFLASNRNWNGGDMGAWLEGNPVVTREGALVDVLRVDTRRLPERAAIVRISSDGRIPSFDPAGGFVDFPGGAKKFTIRWDERSRRYWSLATMVPEGWGFGSKPAGVRNTLALIHSTHLTDWVVQSYVLHHPDRAKCGFQYVDWLFDGDDIIAACRTAIDDGVGGARNNHDANFLTFHRISRFRERTMADSVKVSPPPVPTNRAQP